MENRIEGLDEAIKALTELPRKIRNKGLTQALRAAGNLTKAEIRSAIRRLDAYETGLLDESIAVDKISVKGTRVQTKIGIAPGVKIQAKRLRAARRAAKRSGSPVKPVAEKPRDARRTAHLVEFGSVHNRPKPFMRSGSEAAAEPAIAIAAATLREMLPTLVEQARRESGGR